MRLENNGTRPALVQPWLDSGDRHSTPATAHTPFTLSPPIFRIEPYQQQALRLRYTGEPLTEDRESLFWLNVLEVPPRAADAAQKNQIELSFRTRLRGLPAPTRHCPIRSAAPPAKLQWTLVAHEQGFALQATNPTPYHISLGLGRLVERRQTLQQGAEQSRRRQPAAAGPVT